MIYIHHHHGACDGLTFFPPPLSSSSSDHPTANIKSSSLATHECWRLFCDVMDVEGRSFETALDTFVAPEVVLAMLNVEHHNQALLEKLWRCPPLAGAPGAAGSGPELTSPPGRSRHAVLKKITERSRP